MKATFEAIEHKDIKGKSTYWIKFSAEGKDDIFLNIGGGKFQSIKDLENETEQPKEPELPFEEGAVPNENNSDVQKPDEMDNENTTRGRGNRRNNN